MSQVTRNIHGIIDARLNFDCTFVDDRRSYFKAEPSRRQDLTTYIAARSEHQWLGFKPKRHGLACRVTPAFGQQAHDGSRRLLNRPPCDVDCWPIVLGAKAAGERDFLGHGGLVDILIIVTVGLQSEQTVLPNLHDALRARIEANNKRSSKFLDSRSQSYAGHQRHISGFYAAVGQVYRGRGFGCPRDPYEYNVGVFEPFRVLTVIVQHCEVQSVDSMEIFRIEHVLGASPMDCFRPEVRLKQAQDRPKDGHARQPELTAFFLQSFDEILFKQSIEDQAWRLRDLGKRMIELFFRTDHRIQMLDR